MNKSVIGQLEANIDRALKYTNDLQRKYKELLEVKKELEALLIEHERRIDGLQKHIEDLKKSSDRDLLKRYQEKEVTLKKRIQHMLSRFDDLDLLE